MLDFLVTRQTELTKLIKNPMGTAFEMALLLDLQPELESKDVETLRYMTRSEDYSFQTSLKDYFFTECDEGFDDEWRFIIANNCEIGGEESFSQIRRSVFRDNQLCFRVLLDDDTYYNAGLWFLDWLFEISIDEGLVGYLLDITCFEADLIYFENGEPTLKFVKNCKIPNSLMEYIKELLGGTGVIDAEFEKLLAARDEQR